MQKPKSQYEQRKAIGNIENNPKRRGECLECWKSMLRPTFAPPSTRLSGGRDRCAGGGCDPASASPPSVTSDRAGPDQPWGIVSLPEDLGKPKFSEGGQGRGRLQFSVRTHAELSSTQVS